jgi:HSP20 family molecular chaperone IbpA
MKLHFLFVSMPMLAHAYQAGGLGGVIRRPSSLQIYCVDPPSTRYSSAGSCGPYARRRRQSRPPVDPRQVDDAFRQLQRDLRDLSSDESVSQQKKWVGRAYELMSEFNRDVVDSKDNMRRNESQLEKQRQWVNTIIDFASEMNREIGTEGAPATATAVSDGGEKDTTTPTGVVQAPRFVIRETEEVFQVSFELPGVKIANVDLQIKQDTKDPNTQRLVLSAMRSSLLDANKDDDDADSTNLFQTIVLPPNVDPDQISAKLDMGILVVKIGKKEDEPKEQSRSIPISEE